MQIKGPGNSKDENSNSPASDSAVWQRQQRVREFHACEAVNTTERAPISTVWLSVVPDGSIRTTVVNVEIAQVAELLRSLDALRDEIEAFAAHKRRQGAKILKFQRG